MELAADVPPPVLQATVSADVLQTEFSLLSGSQRAPGLTIEDVISRETVPLLPYVFFDDSTGIPARYLRPGRHRADGFTLRDPAKLPEV